MWCITTATAGLTRISPAPVASVVTQYNALGPVYCYASSTIETKITAKNKVVLIIPHDYLKLPNY